MISQRTAKCKSAPTRGLRHFPAAAYFLLLSPERTAALQPGVCDTKAPRIVINAATESLDITMSICKDFRQVRVPFPPSLSTYDISNSAVTVTSGIDGTFTMMPETTDGRLVAVFKRSGGIAAPNHTAGVAATTFKLTLDNVKNISTLVLPHNYRDNFTDFIFSISRKRVCPKLDDTTIKKARTSWLANEDTSALEYCHIKDWDVSEVTTMVNLFFATITPGAANFNEDLSSWDTSKVKTMNNLFNGASNFNGDLSSWDTSKVTNMQNMFKGASNFNGDPSSWDTSKVTNMGNLFDGASNFNRKLSSWDTSKVTNMYLMFSSASNFNGDLSSWDTSKVTNMQRMFSGASNFNGNLSSWDASKVGAFKADFSTSAGSAMISPSF